MNPEIDEIQIQKQREERLYELIDQGYSKRSARRKIEREEKRREKKQIRGR